MKGLSGHRSSVVIACVAAMLWCILTGPAMAVLPEEMLGDPALEARAQALDERLRCVQCRSESIASSNADWASDARVKVRELIADGATDREVLDFFTARYGEYVLMKPTAQGTNWLLWAAGPFMLVLGGAFGLIYVRRRSRARPDAEDRLSEEEQARLREILHK